jgi:hypothetical protein
LPASAVSEEVDLPWQLASKRPAATGASQGRKNEKCMRGG